MARGVSVFACVLIDHLPVKAEVQREPSLQGRPVVVAKRSGSQCVVLDASPEAAGVAAGMPLSEALSACAGATLVEPDPVHYRAVFDAVLAAIESLSADVQEESLGHADVRLTGLELDRGNAAAWPRTIERTFGNGEVHKIVEALGSLQGAAQRPAATENAEPRPEVSRKTARQPTDVSDAERARMREVIAAPLHVAGTPEAAQDHRVGRYAGQSPGALGRGERRTPRPTACDRGLGNRFRISPPIREDQIRARSEEGRGSTGGTAGGRQGPQAAKGFRVLPPARTINKLRRPAPNRSGVAASSGSS